MNRYPGIQPFSAADQHLFHGRDKEKRHLFQLIVLNDVVVLFGKSGIGKSSLLNAGVCPQLEERHLHPLFIRLNNTDLPPEVQVEQYLKNQHYISEEVAPGLTMWEYFHHFSYQELRVDYTPVVVLDQFEELFTLYTPEERKHFIEQLADIINARVPASLAKELNNDSNSLDSNVDWETPPRVKFVLSIRSDYLYLLDELSADIPAILQTRFQLNPLNRTNAIQAITLPAAMSGAFVSPTFEYSNNAIEEVIEELGKKESDQLRNDLPETEPEIEAFQLQLFCQQLEKKIIEDGKKKGFIITPKFYGGSKGIQLIIEKFYSGVVSRIHPIYQNAVIEFLAFKLISNKRRIMMEETSIIKGSAIPQNVLSQLNEEKIIRKEVRSGSYYYEISHDTLITPILNKAEVIEDRYNPLMEYYAKIINRVPKEHQENVECLLAEGLIDNRDRLSVPAKAIKENYNIPDSIMNQLIVENIIRIDLSRGELNYEITHDTLILPIKEKYKLIQKRIHEEELETLRIAKEKELEDAKRKAEEESLLRVTAEENEIRAMQWTRLAMGISLLALLLAGVAFMSWKVANKANEKKEIALEEAEANSQQAIAANKRTEIALKQANLEKLRADSAKIIALENVALAKANAQEAIVANKGTEIALKQANLEKLRADSAKIIAEENKALAEINEQKAKDNLVQANKRFPSYLTLEAEKAFENEDIRLAVRLAEFANKYDENNNIANALKEQIPSFASQFILEGNNYRLSPDSQYITFATIINDTTNALKIFKFGSPILPRILTFQNSRSFSYSPDGKYLIFFTEGKDGKYSTLNVFNLENNSTTRTFKNCDSNSNSNSYSPDGKYFTFFTEGKDGKYSTLNVLKLESNSTPRTFENSYSRGSLSYSPNEKYFTFYTKGNEGENSTLNVLNLGSNSTRTFENGYDNAYDYSSDGKYLAFTTGKKDRKLLTLNILKLESNSTPRTFENIYTNNYWYSYKYSPDGRYIAFFTLAQGKLGTLNVLKLESDSPSRTFKYSYNNFQYDSNNFSPDGKYFAFYASVRVLDPGNLALNVLKLESDSPPLTVENNYDYREIEHNGCSLNGKYITFYTKGKDRRNSTLNVLNLESNSTRTFNNSYTNDYNNFSPDGKYLTFNGKDSTLNVLKLQSNSTLRTFENSYTSYTNNYCYSPNGKYFAFITKEKYRDFNVNILDLESDKIIRTIFHHYEPKLISLNNYTFLSESTNPKTKRKIYKIIDVSLGDTQQAFEYYKTNFYKPLIEEEKEKYGIID